MLAVATPLLDDPNFARCVVYVLDHDDDGAVGLVLDRPSDTDVGAVLPGWRPLVSDPGLVHVGGPVQLTAAICLADTRATPPAGFAPAARGRLGAIGTVDLDADPDELAPYVERLRVWAGYAGWGSGQLEREVAEGAWWMVDSRPDDVFTADPAGLWRRVLRRQPAPLCLASTCPADPSLN